MSDYSELAKRLRALAVYRPEHLSTADDAADALEAQAAEIARLQEMLSDVLVYSPDYMHGMPKKYYTKRLAKSVKDFPPERKPFSVISADEITLGEKS